MARLTKTDQPRAIFDRPVDRRSFLSAAGASLAVTVGAAAHADVRAPRRVHWDHEADVVVVGSGAAGMSAAIIASAQARVLVVEAALGVGGTTLRSGGGCWIPNNRYMREAGLADSKQDALHYMARDSFAQLYDPQDAHLGLPENDYGLLAAFYDNASTAIDTFDGLGALYMRKESAYDYWNTAPENKAPVGRTIFPTTPGAKEGTGAVHAATSVTPEWHELNKQLAGGSTGAGGPLMVAQMKEWLARKNVPILLGHRVIRLLTNHKGEVIGVQAESDAGQTVSIRARKAVHFGSGGFTVNDDLKRSFLRGPSYGGCGVPTNRGDFVYMATAAGAKLGNMQNGWNISLIMDEAFETPLSIHSVWHIGGDSMFIVNKYGRRVVNEKENYNDRGEVSYDFDPRAREWRNLVLFVIFDQRVRDGCAGLYPFAPAGEAAPYILTSDTLDGLTLAIADRLAKYAERTGNFKLDDSFARNLKDTANRFNQFAETGVDEDFGRGSTAYDLQWHARALGQKLLATNDKLNKTLYPLSAKGPYYAVPLVHGHADTCGGAVINEKAQVLSYRGEPIPGLYGAGNCIASPSGRGYWGGGTTLGLAVTFGYIAGTHAAREPVKAET
jgi:3-oxosteroid 1-dehydrogenase